MFIIYLFIYLLIYLFIYFFDIQNKYSTNRTKESIQ